MPATTLVPATPNAAAAARSGQATPGTDGPEAAGPYNDFVRGSTEHQEPFFDQSWLLSANQVNVGPIDVPSFGYLRHIVLLVTTSGGAGAAAVAHEDSPWRALNNVQLTDVNGAPIVGPMSGYDLYLANKYGVYMTLPPDSDPALSPVFSAVAATGDFSFLIRVPCEVASRDALGSLPNMNAANTYKLSFTVNSTTNIYATPPTTIPTVRVRAWLEAWFQPPLTDLRGVPNVQQPPAMGTTQYWSKSPVNVNAGDQRIRLTRVGNLLRTLVLVFRNATPVRNTTNFPDPLRLEHDGIIVANLGRDLMRHYVRERYGFNPETGVFVFDFTHDLDGKAGNELRDLYLATTQASRVELVGSFGAAGTLDILFNDVAPAGDVYTEL